MKYLSWTGLQHFYEKYIKSANDQLNEIKSALSSFVAKKDIVDNLTTESEIAPLSANMGAELNKYIGSVNDNVALIREWETYTENGWTLKYRKTGHKRYQVQLTNMSPNGFKNARDNLIMASSPLKCDFGQRLVALLHVSQAIVGYGNANFRDGSITISTTDYTGAVTCECLGEVIVK